jgi:hypothetical protein
MSYTPPLNTAVNLNFTETPYTPPIYNIVNLDFGVTNEVGGGGVTWLSSTFSSFLLFT